MSKIEKAMNELNATCIMAEAKHPSIIMNGAGMSLCGSGMMIPVDGIPAIFFNRIHIRRRK